MKKYFIIGGSVLGGLVAIFGAYKAVMYFVNKRKEKKAA